MNARAARVFEPDHWHSRLDSQIHHLADFLRVGFGETAPKHGEVLGKQIHWPTIDQGVTSHYAVPQDLLFPHSKVRATVGHIPIEFHKRPLIHQEVDALTGGELAFLVLYIDAFLPATRLGFGSHPQEALGLGFAGHGDQKWFLE